MTSASAFEALVWARRQKVGGAGRKAVLNMLAEFADKMTWECFPGIATLAEATELDERSVRRALDRLEEDGFIDRRRPRRPDGTLGRYVIRLNPHGEQVVTSNVPPASSDSGDEENTIFNAEIDTKIDASDQRTKCPVDCATNSEPTQHLVGLDTDAPADMAPGGAASSGHCVRIQRTLCPVHIDELPLELPLPPNPQGAAAAFAGVAPADPADAGEAARDPTAEPARAAARAFAQGIAARIGTRAYASWFRAATIRRRTDGVDGFMIGLPGGFVLDMVRQRYAQAVEQAAAAALPLPAPASSTTSRHVMFFECAAARKEFEAASTAGALAASQDPQSSRRAQVQPKHARRKQLRRDGSAAERLEALVFALAVSWLTYGRWDEPRFGAAPGKPKFAPPRGAVARALSIFAAATAQETDDLEPAGSMAKRIAAHWRALDGEGRVILLRRARDLREVGASACPSTMAEDAA